MKKITCPERRERKTLLFHKSVIKKACAALVEDGYDRNQAIGALFEFFLSDGKNPVFFNDLMKSYLKLLKEDTIPFQPQFFNTKKMLREARTLRKDVSWLEKPIPGPLYGRKFKILGPVGGKKK